jgi:hypothetical protein
MEERRHLGSDGNGSHDSERLCETTNGSLTVIVFVCRWVMFKLTVKDGEFLTSHATQRSLPLHNTYAKYHKRTVLYLGSSERTHAY